MLRDIKTDRAGGGGGRYCGALRVCEDERAADKL